MPSAKRHFCLDRFFDDPNSPDGLRRERAVIVAYDEAEAIKESKLLSGSVARFFKVVVVTQKSETTIHDSRHADDP